MTLDVEAEDALELSYITLKQFRYLALYCLCLPEQALVDGLSFQAADTFSDPIDPCIFVRLGSSQHIGIVMPNVRSLNLYCTIPTHQQSSFTNSRADRLPQPLLVERPTLSRPSRRRHIIFL